MNNNTKEDEDCNAEGNNVEEDNAEENENHGNAEDDNANYVLLSSVPQRITVAMQLWSVSSFIRNIFF